MGRTWGAVEAGRRLPGWGVAVTLSCCRKHGCPMKKQPRAIGFLMILPCVLIMMIGCESSWTLRPQSDDGHVLTRPEGTGLVASERPKIADVPMPIGFVAVPSRSQAMVPRSGPRIVTHTYQGVATIADASRFYRQQTPAQGWQMTGERSDGSITTMVFVKGQEELTIQISHPRVLDVVVMIRDRSATAPAAVKP